MTEPSVEGEGWQELGSALPRQLPEQGRGTQARRVFILIVQLNPSTSSVKLSRVPADSLQDCSLKCFAVDEVSTGGIQHLACCTDKEREYWEEHICRTGSYLTRQGTNPTILSVKRRGNILSFSVKEGCSCYI